jgi:Big-like domain-containing protein
MGGTVHVGSLLIIAGLLGGCGGSGSPGAGDGGGAVDGAAAGGDLSPTMGGADLGEDRTPPQIVATVPSDGAVAVAVGSAILIRFSEPMQASSVMVYLDSSILPPGSWDASGAALTVTPAAPLATATHYQVVVEGRDLAGNSLAANHFGFTTAADTTPPTIVSFLPASPAPIDAALQVTFSRPMATVTVTFDPPALLDTAAWSPDARVVTISHAPLSYATSYRVTVAGSDSAGQPLVGTTLWPLTTVADLGAPAVVATTPADGAGDIPLGSAIVIRFDRAMDPTTTAAAISSDGLCPPARWAVSGTTATCAPSPPLSDARRYTITVGTGATSAAGVALPSAYSFAFATVARPTVALTAPGASADVDLKAPLVLTFSKPMSTGSVVLVVQATPERLDGSPLASAVTVDGTRSWSGNQVLTFTPSAPRGYLPGGVERCGVGWSVSGTDSGGNALKGTVAGSWQTVRLQTFTVPLLTATAIDSNGGFANSPSFLAVAKEGGLEFRAFLEFNLVGPLAPALIVYGATLTFSVGQVDGTPALLGKLVANDIYTADVGSWNALWNATPSTGVATVMPTGTGTVSIDVGAMVASDFASRATHGGLSQLRLQAEKPNATGNNGIRFLWSPPNPPSLQVQATVKLN